MGRKALNIVGKKFGFLTAIRLCGSKNNDALWECKCDCGNFTNVRGTKLRVGKIKSCGKCHANVIDISGYKINNIIVLSFAYNQNGQSYWNCKCICGNELIVSKKIINKNAIASCGCRRKKDIAGKKFGKLFVLQYVYSKKGNAYWKCKCECGNEKIICGRSLWRNLTKSCGCEKHITQDNIANELQDILNEKCISDKYFEWLINPITNKKLEIDIYVPSIKLAIEYDGEFHFENKFGTESYIKQQERDEIKNKLIKYHIENNRTDVGYFIRFNYKEKITKNYIIGKLQKHGIIKCQ